MNSRKFLVAGSSLLFLFSLTQRAFVCYSPGYYGYEVLLIGWLGIPFLEPRWLANVLYFVLVYKSSSQHKQTERSYVVTRYIVIPAMLLIAISTIFIPAYACPTTGGVTLSNGLALGGYFWVAALISISTSMYFDERPTSNG